MELRGKQKRFLRSKAHHLNPIFQIGKGGLNDAMIVQVDEALEKRELLKISLLQNTDENAADVAEILENKIDCNVVQIVGRVLVLYKASTQEKHQEFSPMIAKMK